MLFMSYVCHAIVSVHCCLVAPAGKGLTSLLLFVMFNCVFVTSPCGIQGPVWYLMYGLLIFAIFLTFMRMFTECSWTAGRTDRLTLSKASFIKKGYYTCQLLDNVDMHTYAKFE